MGAGTVWILAALTLGTGTEVGTSWTTATPTQGTGKGA